MWTRIAVVGLLGGGALMAMPAHAACSTLASGVIPYLEHNSAGLVTVRTTPTTTAGFAPVEGALAYDTANDVVKACDGTSWNTVSGGASAGVADRISSSGSQAMVLAMPGGTVSFTTGSVAGTSYLDTTGWWVGPGISITTANGISSTNGYFTGNVGIGTNAPTDQLNLTGRQRFTSAASAIYALPSSGFATTLDLSAATNGVTYYNSYGASIRLQSEDPSADGTILFATNKGGAGSSERMRITADGNVGIGTTAPNATLDVVGTVSSTSQFMSKNSAAPTTCNATNEGRIAYTGGTTHYVCLCDGTSWKQMHDVATACTW